jgi:hypothetical protein
VALKIFLPQPSRAARGGSVLFAWIAALDRAVRHVANRTKASLSAI